MNNPDLDGYREEESDDDHVRIIFAIDYDKDDTNMPEAVQAVENAADEHCGSLISTRRYVKQEQPRDEE